MLPLWPQYRSASRPEEFQLSHPMWAPGGRSSILELGSSLVISGALGRVVALVDVVASALILVDG